MSAKRDARRVSAKKMPAKLMGSQIAGVFLISSVRFGGSFPSI